jgi:hypothetical protein
LRTYLARLVILLISASGVARIIGMSHWHEASKSRYYLKRHLIAIMAAEKKIKVGLTTSKSCLCWLNIKIAYLKLFIHINSLISVYI